MSRLPDMIVFSDLDGTLLDHANYSYTAAMPALDALSKTGTPLILASSKTAAEIYELREKLGFSHCPAIVENGAGILSAATKPDESNGEHDYTAILKGLNKLPIPLRGLFVGFNDLSVNKIAEITGLSEEAACNAAQRQFSEPGIWQGTDKQLQEFILALNQMQIHARYGGRFLTLSFGATKGQRVNEIVSQYSDPTHRTISLSLGDAPNDVEMLETTDFGAIISNPHGKDIPYLKKEGTGKIIRSLKLGPAGWNETVLTFLENKKL